MEKFDYLNHYKIDAEKFNYFEERKGATAHEELRVHQFITSLVPKKTKEILDIGCGSAWVAKTFLPKNIKVFSLDISTLNPAKAIMKIPHKNHLGITADSFALPIKNGSIDCVIASEIIEHVVNPKKFINEILRVVKKNGQLIISTPYKEIISYYLCIHCNQMTPANAHLHSFDEKILNNLCEEKSRIRFTWYTFGNKYLIFLRTHVFLKLLPFQLWKLLDKTANAFLPKKRHIIAVYKKLS